MAKKNGINKSELVRQYREKHPDAGPKEITEALKAHKISYGLVANVLQKAKGKTKAKKKTAKTAAVHSNGHAADFVHSAFTLGLDKAIELLQKVKKAVE